MAKLFRLPDVSTPLIRGALVTGIIPPVACTCPTIGGLPRPVSITCPVHGQRNSLPPGEGTGTLPVSTTDRETLMTLDELMLAILDVLIENGGSWSSDTFGRSLLSLAHAAHGEEFPMGDKRYHATSLAVLRLESVGFVDVDRAYESRPGKANVVLEVRVR